MNTAAIVPAVETVSPGDQIAGQPMEPALLTVELIQDEQTFAQMGPLWNRLVDEAGLDHPFIRHEWVYTWWESFKPEAALHILLVKEATEAVAIAPLMADRGRIYGCRVRRLRGIANVYTERFDLILARHAKEACRAIWKFLAAESTSWDILELRQIPEGGRAAEFLPFWAFEDKFLLGQWHSSDGPFIPIQQPWDGYVKTLSKKHLSNLRGRAKGLHRVGEVRHEVVSGQEDLQHALDDAFLLEAAAWKGKAGTAIMNRPDRLAFYRKLLTKAAGCGTLQLHFLKIEHKRIAVQITLVVHGKLYILKSGYDPRYAAYGPSLILLESMLKDAWKRRLTEVDFLGDAERWKLEWASRTRSHSWLFIFPDRSRPRFLHRLKFHWLPRLHTHAWYRLLKQTAQRLRLPFHD